MRGKRFRVLNRSEDDHLAAFGETAIEEWEQDQRWIAELQHRSQTLSQRELSLDEMMLALGITAAAEGTVNWSPRRHHALRPTPSWGTGMLVPIGKEGDKLLRELSQVLNGHDRERRRQLLHELAVAGLD